MASVQTRLTTPRVQPGGVVEGVIEVRGDLDRVRHVHHLAVGLRAVAEDERGGGPEVKRPVSFGGIAVSGGFELAVAARQVVRFSLTVPWQCPVNVCWGRRLAGFDLGLETELDLDGPFDPADVDPLEVVALPAQQALLDAVVELGFRYRETDLELERKSPGQTLDFVQELEFDPPPEWAGRIEELEVSFLNHADRIDVVLEVDKRKGGDTLTQFSLHHTPQSVADLRMALGTHLQQLTR